MSTFPDPGTETLFHPVEHALLAHWLGIEPVRCAEIVDVWSAAAPLDTLPSGARWRARRAPHIRLERDMDGRLGEHSVSNAVARLMLGQVQHRLPQWAVVYDDGQVDCAREDWEPLQRSVSVLPQPLFGVDWGGAPGFSWPEFWHATYLPGYDRYVLTRSMDAPEPFGYCDLAEAHFPAQGSIEAGARRCLLRDWRERAAYDCEVFESVIETGLIDAETLGRWAAEVWPPMVEEDEEMDIPMWGFCTHLSAGGPLTARHTVRYTELASGRFENFWRD